MSDAQILILNFTQIFSLSRTSTRTRKLLWDTNIFSYFFRLPSPPEFFMVVTKIYAPNWIKLRVHIKNIIAFLVKENKYLVHLENIHLSKANVYNSPCFFLVASNQIVMYPFFAIKIIFKNLSFFRKTFGMNDVEKGHVQWSSRALNYIKAQVIGEMVTGSVAM